MLVVGRTQEKNCEGKPEGEGMAKGLEEATTPLPCRRISENGVFLAPELKVQSHAGATEFGARDTTYLLLLEASHCRSGVRVSQD